MILPTDAQAKGIFIKGGYRIASNNDPGKNWMIAFGYDHKVAKKDPAWL